MTGDDEETSMAKTFELKSLRGGLIHEWYSAGSAILFGEVVILDSGSTDQGQVKPAVARGAGGALAASGVEGGIVGRALNDADENEAVQVEIIDSQTVLQIPTIDTSAGTAVPAETLLGVAYNTHYVLYRTVNTDNWALDLATTSGVLHFVNFCHSDVPVGSQLNGFAPMRSGYTYGDRVLAQVPALARLWSQ
jgi:hypothetical protein